MGLDIAHVLSDERHYGSFVCAICQNVVGLDAFVTTICSHVFCKSCLELWLLKDKAQEESREFQQLPQWFRQQLKDQASVRCPSCNTDLKYTDSGSRSSMNHNYAFKSATMMINENSVHVQPLALAQPLAHRVLQQINVRCPFHRKHGCTWQGDYGDLHDHMLSDNEHNVEPIKGVDVSRKFQRMDSDQVMEQAAGEPAVQAETENTNGLLPMEFDDVKDSNILLDNAQQQTIKQQIELASSFKEEGNAKFSEQEFEEASEFYGKAINTLLKLQGSPDSTKSPVDDYPESKKLLAILHSNRALCSLKRQKATGCIEDCRSAIRFDPTFAKAYLRGSKALMELGNFREACVFIDNGLQRIKDLDKSTSAVSDLQILEQELSLNKQINELFLDASSCLALFSPETEVAKKDNYTTIEKEQKLKDAKAKLTQIMTQYKCQAPPVVLFAAKVELELGATDRALRMTLKILKDNPHDAGAYALRGLCLCYMGDFKGGISLLREALRLDPDNNYHHKLWKLFKALSKYVEEGRKATFHRQFEKAHETFSKALKEVSLPRRAPLYATLHTERGEASLRMKRYDDALKDAALAIYSRDDDNSAWLIRVQALQGMGRLEEARDDLINLLQEGSWGANDTSIQRAYERVDFEIRKRQRPDYYALLGLPSVASGMELKQRYKELAQKWHPDKFVSAPEKDQKEAERKFKLLGEALEILGDDFQRRLYDEGYDQAAIRERVAAAERAAHRNGSHGPH